MPVNEMLDRMPAVEFDEWQAYSVIEPFGEIRSDRRAGEIVSLLANVYRDKKKHSQPFKPSDFFPEITDRHIPPLLDSLETAKESIDEPKQIPPNQRAAAKLRQLYSQPAGFRGRK